MSQDPRRDFSVPIAVDLQRGDGSESSEYAVNLSPRGLCLHLGAPITVGERVSVRFDLPPEGTPIEASGKVVWTTHDGELGLHTRFWEAGVHLDSLTPEQSELFRVFASQPINRRR